MQQLPEDIRDFICAHLPSVGHLELLLLLFDGREDRWTIQSLSQEMRTNETLVTQQLEVLNGPVRKFESPVEAFQFVSNNLMIRELVRRLAELYRSHRHTVITEIYTQKDQKIKSFADAFKLRK